MNLEGMDVISLLDFEKEDIERIFATADKLKEIVEKRTRVDLLKDKILGTLFFEPSTRTRLSFESAMLRLGGGVIGFADPRVSRAGDAYKETLADTAKVVENYVDVVAIRHYESGAALEFAEHASIPVINCGDGANEHPTQGLLDMYTIKKEKGTLDGLEIAIIGDMVVERAIHSLLYGLAKYDSITAYLISPKDRRLPKKIKSNLKILNFNFKEVSDISDVIERVDVIYSDTIKISRDAPKTPDAFVVNRKKLSKAKKDVIVLHPLPRLDELSSDVDSTPHAKYFIQPKHGVIVRMALLCLILGKKV